MGPLGTAALQAGLASERMAGTLGKGEQGREVRMQLRRKKPDQGGGYTRAKLERVYLEK